MATILEDGNIKQNKIMKHLKNENQRGVILDKRDQLLFRKLKEEYKNIGNNSIKKIAPIIEGKSKISLRIIEWFVTSFSKRKHLTCSERDHRGNIIGKSSVYRSYKNNLSAYHGKHFSIFKRTKKVNVSCDSQGNIKVEPMGARSSESSDSKDSNEQNNQDQNITLNTTIAQLNFFKWILENDLLTHIENNYDQICKELYEKQKNSNKEQNQTENIEPIESITATVNGKEYETGEIEILVNFN